MGIEPRKFNPRAGNLFWALRDADAVKLSGRQHHGHHNREVNMSPARSETPSMYGNTSRENREVPWLPTEDGTVGRIAKSKDARR